jgi:glycerol-3-phosphate dehydrogenase (NAD(P)+)
MKIGVIGGGAWGTALAQLAAAAGDPVLLWARDPAVVASINQAHVNPRYLPSITLSPAVIATDSLAALADQDALLVVTPAQQMAAILQQLPATSAPLILCCKGIEAHSGRSMSEVAQAVRPANPVAILSGPTFADEVARGLPAAVTLAAHDLMLAEHLSQRLAQQAFRPYASDDVTGAEIGGAVKNVLAIGCGVVAGRALGSNAQAALIARGFAEMTRFGLARGGQRETLAGLSGLGDLVLTCSSTQSRNFALGLALGKGTAAADLRAAGQQLAEGAHTAPILAQLAQQAGIAMPITAAVAALLAGEIDVGAAIQLLLSRQLTRE